MPAYVQEPNRAERISRAFSHLANIAKNIVAMKKLEQTEKQEKDLRTVELINKALPGQGVQAVPMEVGGQQLAPNVLPDQPDFGFGAGIGSPALSEDAIEQVSLSPEGKVVRTPIAPPPLPEGFTFTQVPKAPTDVELLEPTLRLKERIGRESMQPSEIKGTPEYYERLEREAQIERKYPKPAAVNLSDMETYVAWYIKEHPGTTQTEAAERWRKLTQSTPYGFEYFFSPTQGVAEPSTTQTKRLKYNPQTGKSE